MSRTCFITGTSSGFGRQFTEQLLARGDRVAATARRTETLDDLADRHGDRLRRARLDVTDTATMRDVVDRAFTELGRIDVVVSNAGYGLFGAAEELTDEQIDRQLATNLTGSIQLARAVTPHLRRQGGGRFIQIASVGGQLHRRAAGELPPLPAPGDPAKIAAAIIAAADRPDAPFRLTLGSDAYELATAAVHDRLEALRAGRDLAYSTDADDVRHATAG
jgi:NAD(P)-dependent dehydrogenase (short-subunit alcohol dehydrogenase family)